MEAAVAYYEATSKEAFLKAMCKYADMIERVLYNGFLSGISMDGKAFFYENPLEQDPKFNNINPSTNIKESFAITERVEIFECSCCPPNIVRFILSIGNLMYNYDEDTVYIQQYINSEAEFENIRITQKTSILITERLQ